MTPAIDSPLCSQVRHFLASVSPDAVYRRTKIEARAGEERFALTGRVLVKEGWLAVKGARSYSEEDEVSSPPPPPPPIVLSVHAASLTPY